MTIGLTLTAITAYLTIGWRLALRAIPRFQQQAREVWGPDKPEDARIEVRAEAIGMALFWPLRLSGRSFLSLFDRVCDRAEMKAFRRDLNNDDRSAP